MARLDKRIRWKWIPETKRDHSCERCGKVIPKGSSARMNWRRKYIHVGRCKPGIGELHPASLDEPEM